MKRRDFLKSVSGLAAAGALTPAPAIWSSAKAQARSETLLIVSESGPNNLDIHGVGTNVPGYEVSWNCYDRLISHEMKTVNGTAYYDRDKFKMELADDMNVGDMSVTFKLKSNAAFQDGTPVTAKDVKWSFDRMVTVGGFPSFQMSAGSITKPEQFEVVDDYTFKVKLPVKDKLSLPDLGVPVPVILNSELVKKNVTAEDPWGLEWTKRNSAGGGAYKVDSWKPGQELVLVRNEDWKSGPLPKLKKVVMREVPSAGNRRALLERGDVDVSFDLPPKDSQELAKGGKVTVVGTPIENSLWFIGMNVKQPPFDNVKVRQAVSYAVPYNAIMEAVVYGRGIPMFGGPEKVTSAAWPQPSPYKTDIAKAKALMAEAGMADGFATTLSINQGAAQIAEPLATLVQESLGQIGIKVTINKVPGANWRAAILKKDQPILIDTFSGWLNYPDYYFFWGYHGQNAVFNVMSYQNPAMDKLIDAARFETDKAKYEELVKGFVSLAFDEMPRVPLFQYYLDIAMRKNITGYTYWFHRGLDFRPMAKG